MDKIRITYLEYEIIKLKNRNEYLTNLCNLQIEQKNSFFLALMKIKKQYNISDKEMTELIKTNQEL